jgi:hypothetical protein
MYGADFALQDVPPSNGVPLFDVVPGNPTLGITRESIWRMLGRADSAYQALRSIWHLTFEDGKALWVLSLPHKVDAISNRIIFQVKAMYMKI